MNLGRNKGSASAAKDYCDGVSFPDDDDAGNLSMITESNVETCGLVKCSATCYHGWLFLLPPGDQLGTLCRLPCGEHLISKHPWSQGPSSQRRACSLIASSSEGGVTILRYLGPELHHIQVIILQARDSLEKRIPLLIKIAPDLILAEMEDIAEVELQLDFVMLNAKTIIMP